MSVSLTSGAASAPRTMAWLRRGEALAAGAILIAFCSTNLLTWLYGSPDDLPLGAGNPYRRFFLFSYAIILALAVVNWRPVWAVARRLWLLGAFHGLLFASLLWSVQPGATLRGAVALFMTSLAAITLYARFGLDGSARLCLTVLVGLAAASLGLLAVAPDLAVHQDQHAGLLRGVFGHKNVAGNVLALAVPALLLLAARRRRLSPWHGLAAVTIIVVVLMTGSKTSLLVVVAGLALAPASPLAHGDARPLAAAALMTGLTAALLVALIVTAPEALTTLVGKDATFTGRTFIWDALAHLIGRRPLLGYGYSAIWDLPYGPLYRFVEEWGINAGHNAFLDFTVDMGATGLALLTGLFLSAMVAGLRACRYGPTPEGLFITATVLVLALLSLAETVLPTAHRLHWVALVLALIAAHEPRHQRQPRPGRDADPLTGPEIDRQNPRHAP